MAQITYPYTELLMHCDDNLKTAWKPVGTIQSILGASTDQRFHMYSNELSHQ